MTEDRFSLITVKVERAKRHFQELRQEVESFFKTNPYKVGTKRDPQTRRLIYYVVSVAPTPKTIPSIAGDLLHNLRSALDNLAYQLFRVGSGNTATARHVYFPIYDDEAKYRSDRMGKVRGMEQAAIDAIDAVRPFKAGNDLLWKLHTLDNIDKHRTLITAGSAFRAMDLTPSLIQTAEGIFPPEHLEVMRKMPFFVKPKDKLFPLKAGDELFIDRPDGREMPDMQFRFEVALYEPGVVEGELFEILKPIREEVEKVISGFRSLL